MKQRHTVDRHLETFCTWTMDKAVLRKAMLLAYLFEVKTIVCPAQALRTSKTSAKALRQRLDPGGWLTIPQRLGAKMFIWVSINNLLWVLLD